eukprot:gene29627-36915_t
MGMGASGVVGTLAGNPEAGVVDNTGTSARFLHPTFPAVTRGGDIVYVSDTYNQLIRKVYVASGIVYTVAGSTVGYLDGTATLAAFSNPSGLALSYWEDELFISDTGNACLRKYVIAS